MKELLQRRLGGIIQREKKTWPNLCSERLAPVCELILVRGERRKKEKKTTWLQTRCWSLADFQTAQIIYHNPDWKSLRGGGAEQSGGDLFQGGGRFLVTPL